MKVTTLRSRLVTGALSLLVIGASVAIWAIQSKALDVYRSGDFDRTSGGMASCVGLALFRDHPQIPYFIQELPDGVTLALRWSPTTDDMIWKMIGKTTGPTSSHVELHNKDAAPEEIQEVWQVIERCGK
jgi:hypothetical protein